MWLRTRDAWECWGPAAVVPNPRKGMHETFARSLGLFLWWFLVQFVHVLISLHDTKHDQRFAYFVFRATEQDRHFCDRPPLVAEAQHSRGEVEIKRHCSAYSS